MKFFYITILKDESIRYGVIDAENGLKAADTFYAMFDHLMPLWYDIIHESDAKKDRLTSIPYDYFEKVRKLN